ncbi:hypothetical protein L1987_17332 [Smallanthus sonchifolius]|uniref:Uncharacterized protein n=1 Tax=Smallanthus sonchifolius TaxID=185202 RepID=A0ACB9IYM2_9ASTR|nr:hypothetical protein L1987_17332 [Smallanthus sonchifolius]
MFFVINRIHRHSYNPDQIELVIKNSTTWHTCSVSLPLQSVTNNVSHVPESLRPPQHILLLISPSTKAPSVCNSSVILDPPRNKQCSFFLCMYVFLPCVAADSPTYKFYHTFDSKADVKPFTLFKLSCMAGVKGTAIVINTWIEFLSAFIYFNVSIFGRFVVWTISLITLPARALAALRREKQLQAQLSEYQDRLDYLVWDRKELQEHIRIAIKEHEMMELMLSELEEENNEATHKIKHLESALHDLKDENLQLKEVNGKSQWDNDYNDQKHKSNTKDGTSPWKSHHYNKDGMVFTMMHKNGNYDAHDIVNRSVCSDNIVGQRKEAAVSQSLFSALLSVLVGMVVWQAQEPCMPLVVALFMVVGMSLKSVVRLFLTVKNKEASDAVVLLSLNWFILGSLTYPTLPRVAHLSATLFTESVGRT